MILIFKSTNPAWQIKKKKNKAESCSWGCTGGRKETEGTGARGAEGQEAGEKGRDNEGNSVLYLLGAVTIQFTGRSGSLYF